MLKRTLNFFKCGILLAVCLLTTACSTNNPRDFAPVVRLNNPNQHSKTVISGVNNMGRKPVHVVRKGETLFSIAKHKGQDAQRLAVLNGIQPPYKVTAGQKLVFPSSQSSSTVNASKRNHAVNHSAARIKNNRLPAKNIALNKQKAVRIGNIRTAKSPSSLHLSQNKQTTSQNANRNISNIRWRWPVQGRILRPFQEAGKGKGIDIAGTSGKPVKAAAEGIVVYSGNGLKGYGNLIIIKHNEDFLSAYAHNRELRVKEGEQVRLGQEIALMGQTGAEQVKVHFEIRYKGKPVNPLKFLPKV